MRSNRVRRGLGLLVFAVAMVLTVGVGVAAAQTTNDTTYPTVSTPTTTDPCVSTNGASVCGTAVSVPRVGGVAASRSLPFTGGDVALLTVLGLAAVGSGVAIVVLTRRRSTAARA